MDYGLRMMLGGGFYFWLIPLTIIVLVIFSGYKAFWPTKKYEKSRENYQTPLETLKIRFAKGEISEREYENIKSELVKDN